MLKQNRNALTNLTNRYRAVLRRCRLRALALACALTVLPPLPAGANSGGEEGTDEWDLPAYIGSTTGSGGHVIIDSGFEGFVYGGYTTAPGTDATGNTVRLTNGTVTKDVYGGLSKYGNAHNNTVIISGGTVTWDVWGGIAQYGSANGNTVIISGGTVGDVRGGNGGNGIATGNRVILSGAPTLTGLISGGENLSTGDVVSGNLLELRSSGLQAVNIKNWVMTSRAAIKRLKASHDNEKQVRLPF